eukprot:ANDGO_04370.mRNA.1 3'-5' ssDNA/RNA exonuclease TatD
MFQVDLGCVQPFYSKGKLLICKKSLRKNKQAIVDAQKKLESGPAVERPLYTLDPPSLNKCESDASMIDCMANLVSRKFDRDLEAVLRRSRNSGVRAVIVSTSDFEKIGDLLNLCKLNAGELYAAVGIHPDNIKRNNEKQIDKWLEELHDHALVSHAVAMNCALDFTRDLATHYAQEKCVEGQIKLATEIRLPVVVQHASAHEKLVELLVAGKELFQEDAPSVAVFNFQGSETELQAFLDLDCYIMITGVICDPLKPHPVLDLLPRIPASKLLLASNSPFDTPQNIPDAFIRETRNEPSNFPYILETVAAKLGVTVKQIAATTLENAIQFYGLSEYDPTKDAALQAAESFASTTTTTTAAGSAASSGASVATSTAQAVGAVAHSAASKESKSKKKNEEKEKEKDAKTESITDANDKKKKNKKGKRRGDSSDDEDSAALAKKKSAAANSDDDDDAENVRASMKPKKGGKKNKPRVNDDDSEEEPAVAAKKQKQQTKTKTKKTQESSEDDVLEEDQEEDQEEGTKFAENSEDSKIAGSSKSALKPALQTREALEYACKMCRKILFCETDVLSHSQGVKGSRDFGKKSSGSKSQEALDCDSFFISEEAFNDVFEVGEDDKIDCPHCEAKLGKANPFGAQCNCGCFMPAPAYRIGRSRVEVVVFDGFDVAAIAQMHLDESSSEEGTDDGTEKKKKKKRGSVKKTTRANMSSFRNKDYNLYRGPGTTSRSALKEQQQQQAAAQAQAGQAATANDGDGSDSHQEL